MYSIKKGRSQQYIKNDDEFDKVMLKRAAEALVVRYGEGAAKLEGSALSKFMSVLKEYLAFFDKVDKRIRDEQVTALISKFDLSKKSDFEGDKKAALTQDEEGAVASYAETISNLVNFDDSSTHKGKILEEIPVHPLPSPVRVSISRRLGRSYHGRSLRPKARNRWRDRTRRIACRALP